MPVIAYIGLGSNVGDKKAACRKAVELLGRAGTVTKVSSFYCSEPVGFTEQEEFVNAVAEIRTGLSPEEMLAACRAIENELGRKRGVPGGPRTLDLDILLYGDRIVKTADLTVPHPLMAERRFVLYPLAEIAPDVVHPVLGKTAATLLSELKDVYRVVKCNP